MDYYHNLITEKSWQELTRLRRRADFVLIGGWAAFLYTQVLKSKDIDIVVDYDQLPLLAQLYDVRKNDRLKKYEARKEEVQIDIYLPHYSQIGISAEDIIKTALYLEGFRVAEMHHLIGLKLFVFGERANSPKGRKDFFDLTALVSHPACEADKLRQVLQRYPLEQGRTEFIRVLRGTYDLAELGLTKHTFARQKRAILQLLAGN